MPSEIHFASENLSVRVDAAPSEVLNAFTLFDASELTLRPGRRSPLCSAATDGAL